MGIRPPQGIATTFFRASARSDWANRADCTRPRQSSQGRCSVKRAFRGDAAPHLINHYVDIYMARVEAIRQSINPCPQLECLDRLELPALFRNKQNLGIGVQVQGEHGRIHGFPSSPLENPGRVHAGGVKNVENNRQKESLGGIHTFPFRYTSALLIAGILPRPVGGPNCGRGPLPASLASAASMTVSPAPAGARPGSSILLPGACEGGDIVGDPPLVLLTAAGE